MSAGKKKGDRRGSKGTGGRPVLILGEKDSTRPWEVEKSRRGL